MSMIAIEYDQPLVEQATFLFARRDRKLECELHESIDPLYRIRDNGQRNDEFGRVWRNWFVRFNLDRLIPDLIAERPHIRQRNARCVVHDAPRHREQSAELFLSRDGSSGLSNRRTLVIRVCADSLVDPQTVVPLMRRELLHVSDMLDERFDYAPQALEGSPSTQNLVRDRYRILWDVYVEGRLAREGKVVESDARALQRAFKRAFTMGGLEPTMNAFDTVFALDRATHGQLLDWAKNPVGLFATG